MLHTHLRKAEKLMKFNKKSFVVLGLGKFGSAVAAELTRAGANVLAVDIDEEYVNDIKGEVTRALVVDVCDTSAMAKLGLSNMDAAVVAITKDINASILAVIACKEAGIAHVIAKSKDPTHTKILEKIGADKIIVPEKESGVRVAHSMLSGSFREFYEISKQVNLIEITPKNEWIGHSLRELDLRRTENVNVVAVRKGEDLSVSPDPDAPIEAHHTLLVMVNRKDINKLVK